MLGPEPAVPSIRSADGSDGSAEFEALFHRQYGSLCEFVRGYVRAPEVAEELVQDLFVRLWEIQERVSGSPLAESYLYTAARNRALGWLRRERVARRYLDRVSAIEADRSPPESPADLAQARDLDAAIRRAVSELPERCRLVFVMSRYHGHSYSDIARVLGVSLPTVETQMSRALRALRSKLAPFLGLAGAALVGLSELRIQLLR